MSKIAMIFSGQGSQAVGMGQDFYNNSELAREMFDKAGERIGVDFKELIFEENEKLGQTAFTQPAILLVQMIAYKLFKDKCPDIKATLFLGHSLGEFSAICASGAIDYIDAVELVHKRGSFMQAACETIEVGMMAIVGLDDDAVEKVFKTSSDFVTREMIEKLLTQMTKLDMEIGDFILEHHHAG